GVGLGERIVLELVSDTFAPLGNRVNDGTTSDDPRTLGLQVWGVKFLEHMGETKPESTPNSDSRQLTKVYRRDYYHSFTKDRDLPQDFDWDGLDPAACVHFEPAGLRIDLPDGHPGKRMGTGLYTNFAVKGDFEITMSYEVLKEPAPADAGEGTGGY